jgi:hypothetical protein
MELEHWTDGFHVSEALAPHILPNLTILIPGGAVASYLVPGRPITHLDCTANSSSAVLKYIAQSSRPLKLLELSGIDDHLRVLLDIPAFFPDLVILGGIDIDSVEVCISFNIYHIFYQLLCRLRMRVSLRCSVSGTYGG